VSETADSNDPWEGFNRKVYVFNDNLDHYILKPVARVYDDIAPKPVNQGVTNIFSNVNDVFVTLNDLLQAKFKQAGSDAGRFLVNSTLGVGGMFDWASGWGMEKHKEDFGQTLGYWGVGQGPYLVVPFFGPRTVRDTGGLVVDIASNPAFFFAPIAASVSTSTVDTVDRRADLLNASRVVEEAALDPYIFNREAYLQRRNNLVYDGNPPQEEFEEGREEAATP
jgi:phospholipid-binding lipoprotein MlaA